MQFNHADLFEGVADAIAERTALICGARKLTYADLDAQASRLAHYLDWVGVRPGQHVGMQLYSGVEYAVAIIATLKIRAVPVNVNYRYVESELEYVYRDADLVAIVCDAEFSAPAAAAALAAPALRHFIMVGGRAGSPVLAGMADWVRYEDAVAGQPTARGFPSRSSADVYIIYTGGTTGMPKGVMWHTEDLFSRSAAGIPAVSLSSRPGNWSRRRGLPAGSL